MKWANFLIGFPPIFSRYATLIFFKIYLLSFVSAEKPYFTVFQSVNYEKFGGYYEKFGGYYEKFGGYYEIVDLYIS